jgi:bifunctional non-homologous end joining protein LigD
VQDEGEAWLLIKHKDRFVTKADVTRTNRSVLSGIAVEDMKSVPAHRIDAGALVPAGASRDAREARADACRDRRRRLQQARLDVGAEARRLSRHRLCRPWDA